MTGRDLTWERGDPRSMPVGYQEEELPIKEEAILGVDLVNSPLGQIGSADVKPHRETFDDHRSDLQGLSPSSYCEG